MWFITRGNFSQRVSHFDFSHCSTDSDSLLLDKERNWSKKFLLMLRAIKGIVFPRCRISEGMVSRPPKGKGFTALFYVSYQVSPKIAPWRWLTPHEASLTILLFHFYYRDIPDSNQRSQNIASFSHSYFISKVAQSCNKLEHQTIWPRVLSFKKFQYVYANYSMIAQMWTKFFKYWNN